MRTHRMAAGSIGGYKGSVIVCPMPAEIDTLIKPSARIRAYLSFFIVAAAQFLSPAAAADPASKIDPPVWSYRHSKEEIQAYGARAAAGDLENITPQVIRAATLRRILKQQQHGN